jgi:hypothetical protein
MQANRIVPISGICVLALVVLLNFAREQKAQTFDGVYVRGPLRSEFYPRATGCSVSGTPYWLVSNDELDSQTPLGPELLEGVPDVWQVRFVGDLSRIGTYDGLSRRYWRIVRVTSSLRVARLDSCRNIEGRN